MIQQPTQLGGLCFASCPREDAFTMRRLMSDRDRPIRPLPSQLARDNLTMRIGNLERPMSIHDPSLISKLYNSLAAHENSFS